MLGISSEPAEVKETVNSRVKSNIALDGSRHRYIVGSSNTKTFVVTFTALSDSEATTLKNLVGSTNGSTIDSASVFVENVTDNDYYDALGNHWHDVTVKAVQL